MIVSLLYCFTAALAFQGGKPPIAPPIPLGCAPAERQLLLNATEALSKKGFAAALWALKSDTPVAAPRVWVDWSSVPAEQKAGYSKSLDAAILRWNTDLKGLLRFKTSDSPEKAEVRVFFQPTIPATGTSNCLTASVETGASNGRSALIYMALNTPMDKKPHSAGEVEALFENGLGVYLGLPQLNRAQQPTAGSLHAAADVALKPTAENIDTVIRLQQARTTLLGYATKQTAVTLPHPEITLEGMSSDCGDVWRGDSSKFLFKVKNTGNAPLEIDAKPSCGCTVVRSARVIAPGAAGVIEGEFASHGFNGKVTKTIGLSSTDPDQPELTLVIQANVLPVVTIEPPAAGVIPLKEGAPTTYNLKVHMAGPDPVEVTAVALSQPYATSKFAKSTANGGKDYDVTLTIAANAPSGRSQVGVIVTTTSKHDRQANIQLTFEKGIVVTPPSVSLGAITSGTQYPLVRSVTLTKASGPFHVVKVEGGDPKLTATFEDLPDGKGCKISFSYAGGWTKGTVVRMATIHTDDPNQPLIQLTVVGQVMGR